MNEETVAELLIKKMKRMKTGTRVFVGNHQQSYQMKKLSGYQHYIKSSENYIDLKDDHKVKITQRLKVLNTGIIDVVCLCKGKFVYEIRKKEG